MILEHLNATRFLCGASPGAFDTNHRVCRCPESLGFPVREHSCYVTILPEPK